MERRASGTAISRLKLSGGCASGALALAVLQPALSSAADAQVAPPPVAPSAGVPGPLAPAGSPPPQSPTQAPPAPAPSSDVDQAGPPSTSADVVVTGSRVVTNGYQAPTPVSVLSAQALSAIAPTNVADAVNRLPALSNSVTPRSQPTSITSGAIGVNQLNLRSLGAQRTLVLLDGKRVVNSSAVANSLVSYAAPDVNTVPNALVSRVDVVTGGASAAYGSDALSGVVNFVIDHKFSGIKGTVQGGVTTYGDDPSYLVSLAAGKGFADDRGHILASAEYAYNDGIRGANRPWNANSAAVLMNPAYTTTNGQPFYILARQVGVSTGTPGGLVTTGALRGTVFGPNASQGTFNFGTVSNNNLMSGGDWQTSRIDNTVDLDSKVGRLSTYGRVSYDIFDNVEFYAEGQYSRTTADATATPNRRLNNIPIYADNYYFNALPNSAALRAALTAAGQIRTYPTSTFTLGV